MGGSSGNGRTRDFFTNISSFSRVIVQIGISGFARVITKRLVASLDFFPTLEASYYV